MDHPSSDNRLSAAQSGHRPLGAFCIAVGAFALWIGQGYEFGTFLRMGPGFVPQVISGALILLGILIIANGGRDVKGEAPLPPFHPRAFLRIALCILGSLVVFGATLAPFGLAVGVFLMICVAMLAQNNTKPITILATALVLAIFAVVLFPITLGISIPIWPQGMR